MVWLSKEIKRSLQRLVPLQTSNHNNYKGVAMAGVSLNHRAGVINLDSDLIDLSDKQALSDALYQRLLKASALSQVALSIDYKQHSQSTLFHYFSALSDYVDEAALIAEYLELE